MTTVLNSPHRLSRYVSYGTGTKPDMEPGEGVTVQYHEIVGHLPGNSDPVLHQLLVHVEQHVVSVPEKRNINNVED